MGEKESKKSRFPSIWGNILSLFILFALIIGAHFWVENRDDEEEMPPLPKETQLILEETDTNPEVEGTQVVVIPPAEIVVPKEEEKKEEAPVAKEVTITEVPKESPKAPEVKVKVEVVPQTSFDEQYREQDPFTSGGEQDLDRLYVEEKMDQENSATLSRNAKSGITERDLFIPFENPETTTPPYPKESEP